MLEVLVASRPPRVFRLSRITGSLAAHLLLALLAVEASRVEAPPTGPAAADTTLLFLPRLGPPPVRPADAPRPASAGGPGGGVGNLVLSENPPPKGFQTVIAPSDIPTTIPPVDLAQPALDPRNFAGRGQEGGVAWGVIGGTGAVDAALLPADVLAGEVVYAATLEHAQFEPALLIRQPLPRYPRSMETIGMGGRVVIQFVIDTVGTVELRSIQVVESSHRAFEEPARESVARAVFRPARLGVRPVRQLTRQPINFVINQ